MLGQYVFKVDQIHTLWWLRHCVEFLSACHEKISFRWVEASNGRVRCSEIIRLRQGWCWSCCWSKKWRESTAVARVKCLYNMPYCFTKTRFVSSDQKARKCVVRELLFIAAPFKVKEGSAVCFFKVILDQSASHKDPLTSCDTKISY